MYTSIIFINNTVFSRTRLCTVHYCALYCFFALIVLLETEIHLITCVHTICYISFFFWLTLNHTSFEKWRSLGDSLWCGQMVFRSSRKRRPAVIGRQPGFRLEGFFVFRCKKCVSDKQKCGKDPQLFLKDACLWNFTLYFQLKHWISRRKCPHYCDFTAYFSFTYILDLFALSSAAQANIKKNI